MPMDLEPAQLRKLVEDGVFRGVSKAIAVYLLISALVGLLYSIISNS